MDSLTLYACSCGITFLSSYHFFFSILQHYVEIFLRLKVYRINFFLGRFNKNYWRTSSLLRTNKKYEIMPLQGKSRESNRYYCIGRAIGFFDYLVVDHIFCEEWVNKIISTSSRGNLTLLTTLETWCRWPFFCVNRPTLSLELKNDQWLKVGKLHVAWEGLDVNSSPFFVFLQCGDCCNSTVPWVISKSYDHRVVPWHIDSPGHAIAKLGWIQHPYPSHHLRQVVYNFVDYYVELCKWTHRRGASNAAL